MMKRVALAVFGLLLSTNVWAVNDLVILTPTYSFTRPTDTTAYAIGDLVANDTTSTLVVPMSWAVVDLQRSGAYIRRARMKKPTTGVTAPNFRIHLFTTSPTPGVGDNVAYASTSVGWFCDIDVNMYTTDPFSDGSSGVGTPNSGSECAVLPTVQTIYGLLEARGAYAPGNAEVFTVVLEVYEP